MKKMALLAMLAIGMLLGSCASTSSAPQQGGVCNERYFCGTYSAVLANSLINVDKAVRDTCEKARLVQVYRRNTSNSCEYNYKDVNKIPLRITLEERKDNTVKITLKVGGVTGWDKQSCQVLLVEIDNRLRGMSSAE